MITIVPYDSAWPSMFTAEAARIHQVLGDFALRVEHVGSTSVPGLAAKPVIDIQVSVPSLKPIGNYIEALARAGYIHIPLGPFDSVYPFFQKPGEWPSTHHIHLCVTGSEQEYAHLAFRDYLRDRPAVTTEYAKIKRQLAAIHHGATLESRESYSLSKTEFVTRSWSACPSSAVLQLTAMTTHLHLPKQMCERLADEHGLAALLQLQDHAAAQVARHAGDRRDIDDGRAMHLPEARGVEFVEQFLDGLSASPTRS